MQRGEQTISRTAKSILLFFGLILAVLLVLVYLKKMMWLDFLYYCSYIKLIITLIKYIPQVYGVFQFLELFKFVMKLNFKQFDTKNVRV